jgi:hypothetical protein
VTFNLASLEAASREPSSVSLSDIEALFESFRADMQKPFVWRVSSLVRNRLARRSLAVRKAWPAKRRFRRAVHRAYRKSNHPFIQRLP